MFDNDGVPPEAEFGVNTDPNDDLESMGRIEVGEDIEVECDMIEAVVSEVVMAREQDDSGLVSELSNGVSNTVLSEASLDAVETRLVPKDASTDGDPPRKALMSLDPNIRVD
ncbi:hypothetical protein BGZ82_002910 [Podila clonocystis]|nr:hypothetical protein BGZ82_002910 [Podila clonocystis]